MTLRTSLATLLASLLLAGPVTAQRPDRSRMERLEKRLDQLQSLIVQQQDQLEKLQRGARRPGQPPPEERRDKVRPLDTHAAELRAENDALRDRVHELETKCETLEKARNTTHKDADEMSRRLTEVMRELERREVHMQEATLAIELEGKEKELDRVRTDLQLENPLRNGGGEQILNPDFTKQATVVAELESELKANLEVTTELHPKVKELREKINIERESLKDIPEFRDSKVVQVINKTHDALRGRETALEAEIEGIRAKIVLIRKEITRLSAANQLQSVIADLQARAAAQEAENRALRAMLTELKKKR